MKKGENRRKKNNKKKNNRTVISAGMVPVLGLALVMGAGVQGFGKEGDASEAYDQYIREQIVPVLGYADLEPASQYIQADMAETFRGWNRRSGILGADVSDLDGDGTEELLLYYFGSEPGTDGAAEPDTSGVLYADLYTRTEEKVTFVGTQKLCRSDGIGSSCVHAGLMTIDETPYLYLEWISEEYFTEGGDSGYVWCSYADGEFVPVWQLVQTGNQENGLAYVLLTRKDDGSYDEAVLWADSAYREQHTDVFVYTIEGSSLDDAVRLGFQILGLSEPEAGAEGYLYEAMPSYQNADNLQPSFVYAERGAEGQTEGTLLMTATVEAFTGLQERLEALGDIEAETETESEPETETETEEALEAEPETENEPETETETETEEISEAEPESESEPEPETETETEEVLEAVTETESEPETETEAVTETENEPETETEEASEAVMETESEPETETEIEIETEEASEAEAESQAADETEAETESLTMVHVQVPARQYYASVQGYGGIIKTSVMLGENDEILDVSVIECDGETEDIGRPAAERVAKEIAAQQNVEVDGISGATVTSDAVIQSVKAVLHIAQAEREQEESQAASAEEANGETAAEEPTPESEGAAGQIGYPGSEDAAGQIGYPESEGTAIPAQVPESEKSSSLSAGEAEFPITREDSFSLENSNTLPSGNAATGDTSFYTDGTAVMQNQFIMPESGSRYLTAADLSRLTLKGVSYVKNEIYAKHGRKFLAQELQEYFGRQSWYSGTIEAADFTEAQVNTLFNEYEKANIRFISEWEAAHGEYQY